MLLEGINGLENQKSFHMALEFVTIYNFDMYLPSVLGIYTTQNRKQSWNHQMSMFFGQIYCSFVSSLSLY